MTNQKELTRINKFLAESGICSRREADRLIESGKVTINSKKANLGDKVTPNDSIKVNNKPLPQKKEKIYIAFHKPYGVITTTDPKADNNIMEHINLKTRVYPIGRLDVESSGLILLTNDGEIVNRLLKSKNKQEKEYIVTLNKPFTREAEKKLSNGIKLEERRTLPAKVKIISSHQISISIVQGMNRQVRRMCEKIGYHVKVLKRVKFAGIQLGDLQRGKWRYLTKAEIESLTTPN